jgi:hypothetical protein
VERPGAGALARTTIAVYRTLGRLVGLQEGELRRLVRISYAKVAEFQRRGAIHFHAVIRVDAATDCRCAGCLVLPPDRFTAALLEKALREAVAGVGVSCPPLDHGPARYARWGEQFDVHNITRDEQAGELSAEQVAAYIAKYATKATESFGSGLDRRLGADDLEHLDGLPVHVAELVRACWELGGRPELDRLRLRAWAHMLGFRGHWSTKSRRYSTTMTVLRRARVAFAKRRRARDGIPWTPGADPRTTRPSSSSPPGPTWARATRPRGSAGWPCRPPREPGNSAASPGRS